MLPTSTAVLDSFETLLVKTSDPVFSSATYVSMGLYECSACLPGSYKPEESTAACTLCGHGKFGNRTAATECSECPIHTKGTSNEGTSSVTGCLCLPGYYGRGPCAPCKPGTFKVVNGSSRCLSCSFGKFSNVVAAISNQQCQECGANTYSLPNHSGCVNCPANSVSLPGGGSALNCTCARGHTGSDGQACVACGLGTYKQVNGTSACLRCAPGKYSHVEGAQSDVCQKCPANSFSSSNSSVCLSCPANSISSILSALLTDCKCGLGYTGPDGGACVACGAGKFKDANGTAPCVQCQAGEYSILPARSCQDCPSNSYSSSDNSVCVSCPSHSGSSARSFELAACKCDLGYTGPDGGECTSCPAGTYKGVNGSRVCSQCGRGKYSTATAATSEATCSACPMHTYSGKGSSRIDNCTCNEGYTGTDGRACEACVMGTFKEVNGSAPCSLCRRGTYSGGEAQTSETACRECPRRTHSEEGSSANWMCVCNKGYTGPDGAECSACVAGKYKAVNGSSSCTSCALGSVTNMTASLNCTWCAEGKTSDDLNASCFQCMAGTYSQPPYVPVCEACKAGTFSNSSQASHCLTCPQNTFTRIPASSGLNNSEGHHAVGATICTVCAYFYILPDYLEYKDIESPSMELCSQAEFKSFCTESGQNRSRAYIGNRSVFLHEIPDTCSVDTLNVTNTTNRTEDLCSACTRMGTAAALAGTVSAALGAAAAAAAAAGGSNPALIDQIQFMSIIGGVGGSQANPEAQSFSDGFGW